MKEKSKERSLEEYCRYEMYILQYYIHNKIYYDQKKDNNILEVEFPF